MANPFKNIKFERENKIAIVTVDRPERKNAFDVETMLELQEAVQQIEKEKEVLALILTGTGEEALISGGDLKYFQTLDNLYKGREMSILCGNLLDSIEELDICLLNTMNARSPRLVIAERTFAPKRLPVPGRIGVCPLGAYDCPA